MNLNFNRIASIIDKKYNASLSTSDHCWNILSCNLNNWRKILLVTTFFFYPNVEVNYSLFVSSNFQANIAVYDCPSQGSASLMLIVRIWSNLFTKKKISSVASQRWQWIETVKIIYIFRNCNLLARSSFSISMLFQMFVVPPKCVIEVLHKKYYLAHLETTITNASNHTLVFSSLSISKCGTNWPTNGSVLHLEFITASNKKKIYPLHNKHTWVSFKTQRNVLFQMIRTYPQFSGSRSFWQLNHESPVSAITADSPLSISC